MIADSMTKIIPRFWGALRRVLGRPKALFAAGALYWSTAERWFIVEKESALALALTKNGRKGNSGRQAILASPLCCKIAAQWLKADNHPDDFLA